MPFRRLTRYTKKDNYYIKPFNPFWFSFLIHSSLVSLLVPRVYN